MWRPIAGSIALATLSAGAASAKVVRIEIRETRDWAKGQSLKAGSYEAVSGTVWYEIDPTSPEARDIADVRFAPRNARGMVGYHGPFLIVRPKQAGGDAGVTVFEVANRGGEQTNRILFHADAFGLTDPSSTNSVGHGPLFHRGYTFAWAGWQADLGEAEFGLTVPRAAVNGTVRATEFLNVQGRPADRMASAYSTPRVRLRE